MINEYEKQIIVNLHNEFPETKDWDDVLLLEFYSEWEMSDKSCTFMEWCK